MLGCDKGDDDAFQPFLRFWNAQLRVVLPRHLLRVVSTLLEILVVDYAPVHNSNISPVSTLLEILETTSANAAIHIRDPGRFQPFLRFWNKRYEGATLQLYLITFQPFLRFWAMEVPEVEVVDVKVRVSTLLEILAKVVALLEELGFYSLSTLLEILGVVFAAGGLWLYRYILSTLLEILVWRFSLNTLGDIS